MTPKWYDLLMQIVSAQAVSNKKVLLRYDLDVPLSDVRNQKSEVRVVDDFRLKAGLETLKLCLEHSDQVILMGHIGRPNGEDPNFSIAPIYQWLKDQGFSSHLVSEKLRLLENLRFEDGEDDANLDYAKELASYGNYFVNEAFAAHHKAASTTVLPTLLPHSAGLNFAKEAYELKKVRDNPQKPLVTIIGGVKIEDKLPAIEALAKIADSVLVGGKIAEEIREVPENVLVARLNEDGTDLSSQTIESWKEIIRGAKQIVWNGPMGQLVSESVGQSVSNSENGTHKMAKMILDSGAESIVGGGDTVGALNKWGLLEKFSFVSTGGGAMLKFLSDGTLPTIEALS